MAAAVDALASSEAMAACLLQRCADEPRAASAVGHARVLTIRSHEGRNLKTLLQRTRLLLDQLDARAASAPQQHAKRAVAPGEPSPADGQRMGPSSSVARADHST